MSAPLDVVAALIRRDGRYLLARRIKDDEIGRIWEFPGGRVEDGESLPAALRRELREELDVEARVGARRVVTRHDYRRLSVRLHFYDCEIDGADPRGAEGQDLLWASPEELPDLDMPAGDREVIEQLSAFSHRPSAEEADPPRNPAES